GLHYEFSNEDAIHAIKVLRLSTGEIFNLSDGKGAWARVVIEDVAKKSMRVKVLETGFEKPLDTTFTIVQAIPKGDRIKDAIELSTEGGADRIVMWKATRSIGRSEDKIEKLQLTAREASKQSRRFRIPVVAGVATTENIVDEIAKSDLTLILHESAVNSLSSVVTPGSKNVLILIGPEGGLTDEEIETFAAAGGKVVLMGRPILRSAHAGLAALAAVNTALSVW
ncbi:MAG: 16S rRNA (uracil(1498)-N(3))-methyltransferase, partial [Actinobacteria bacterium]|nr:16S rRNA (uracil(1498)-N(3))-methyltransferase [Actinomycetota bacterium]